MASIPTIDQYRQSLAHQLVPETTSLCLNLTKAGIGMLIIPVLQDSVHLCRSLQKGGFTLGTGHLAIHEFYLLIVTHSL
jgi:hypothetical protein